MGNLIYILGPGRNGSTVFERALASSKGIFALGEIHCVWRMPLEKLTCSCGDKVPQCEFWREVFSDLGTKELPIEMLRRAEERYSRSFAVAFGYEARKREPGFGEFIDFQRRLYSSIRKISNRATLVDSSKAAPRAVLSMEIEPTKYVYVKRRTVDVMTSWSQKKFDKGLNEYMEQRGAFRVAADVVKNDMVLKHFLRGASGTVVEYERFAEHPQHVMEEVLRQFGVAEHPAWVNERSFKADGFYHSLNGNPDRYVGGVIEIRRGEVSQFARLGFATRKKMELAAAMSKWFSSM